MFITKIRKYHEDGSGKYVAYDYYRLTKSYRDAEGKEKKCHVLCLGELTGLSKSDRDELARMLTVMIEQGEAVICENQALYELAMGFYVKYRENKLAEEKDLALRLAAEKKEKELQDSLITIRLESLVQKQARTIGPEAICRSTVQLLKIRQFLNSKHWDSDDINIALMQIIARAIYPYSELKTLRYIRDNSALLEMFKIDKDKVTKDVLYKSALRLWDVHRELEDYLHDRVCSMFHLEEKILLFDITNTYFEGRMDSSKICRFGRSKEKRDDCKIVILAAVVNTDGLLVRTMIYEGNRQDVTTLQEVIGSLAKETSANARRIVVMDAGFYSKENTEWLVNHGFDYITVLPAGASKFKASTERVVRHEDCRHKEIRLQLGQVEVDGVLHKALLVDSDAKALKEQSMHNQACNRYEEGLRAIKNGLSKKGGTKSRDAVNARLGRLYEKYGAIRKEYEVSLQYEGSGKNEKVVAMEWQCNADILAQREKFHGQYVLLTNLDENEEINIWKFYNVIRTVEETFHTLKTDIDIRPVYHKSDNGIKAHLNLAVLAYWVVSVTKYRLKMKQYPNVRWDEIIRISQTQVVVTAEMKSDKGEIVSVRQSTEAENELSKIYELLDIISNPIGKVKSVVHPKAPPKKTLSQNQAVT